MPASPSRACWKGIRRACTPGFHRWQSRAVAGRKEFPMALPVAPKEVVLTFGDG